MMNIYCMIENNTYDYEDPYTTTDDIEVAYNWIREGCEEVAILDALSYEYYGYMNFEDLPEFIAHIEELKEYWED